MRLLLETKLFDIEESETKFGISYIVIGDTLTEQINNEKEFIERLDNLINS